MTARIKSKLTPAKLASKLISKPITTGAAPRDDTRRVPVTMDDMFRMRGMSDVQITADGKRVAFVLAEWVANQPKMRARIWVAETAGGQPRPFTNGARNDGCPRWSPDGKQLAFVSEREGDDGKPQIYVMSAAGGEARRVCQMPNGAGEISWSPDGTRLAFIAIEGPEPSKDPIVVEDDRHRRLWTVRLESDTAEPVTPPDLTVWHHAWAPGGDRFAVFYAEQPGESGWYQGQLGLVAAGGGAIRPLGHLERQAAALAWSPDGKQLAYVQGEWSDRPLVGGDLWVIPVEGGAARNLTPGAEVSVSWAAWLPSGKELLIAGWDRVWNVIGTVAAEGGAITPLATQIVIGEGYCPRLSATPDRARFAAVRMDAEAPNEVWLGEIKAGHRGHQGHQAHGNGHAPAPDAVTWKRLTQFNALLEETVALAPSELVIYPSADDWQIDGLLTMPREAKRGTPPPLILMVHGGPSSANRAVYGSGFSWVQQFAAAGFAVLQPNFRGSLGRGVAFADAILGDMGGKDLQDCLLGVEHLVATGRVDGKRLGIFGWSYGGFATAWGVTQTTRFKAAIMGAGVSDFHSFHAQSNIPDWDRRFLGANLLERPEAYRARSAITFASRVTTPTLIVHGERDDCVPVNQAYAFHRALRERGVPTQLVVYPREGHGPSERDHLRDLSQRMVAWWERYL
ncbi:MAG TPA: S9 family peptidase [Ktedonobacterales bacterium]